MALISKLPPNSMKKLHDAEETADNKIIVHTSTIGGGMGGWHVHF